VHALKTPVLYGGGGLVTCNRAKQAGQFTGLRRPPWFIVSIFSFKFFNSIFNPAPAGVDRKGSETQVAQTCVIALRLWRKFPLAK